MQEVVGEAVLVEIVPPATFDIFCDLFVVVILKIELGRDQRVVRAEELLLLDDQCWSSSVGSRDENVEHVSISVYRLDDVLHEVVVVEQAQEFDCIEVDHHVKVDVDIPDESYR